MVERLYEWGLTKWGSRCLDIFIAACVAAVIVLSAR